MRVLDALRRALAVVLLAGGAGAAVSLLLARHEGAVYQTFDTGHLGVEDLSDVVVPAVAALLGAAALCALGLWARGDRRTDRPLGPTLLPGVLDLDLLDAAALAGAGLIHLRLRGTDLTDPALTVLVEAVWALAAGTVLLPLHPTASAEAPKAGHSGPTRRGAVALAALALASAGAGAVATRTTGVPPLLDTGELRTGPDPDLTTTTGPNGR